MENLVKTEIYTFDKDNNLIKFNNGKVERVFGKNYIKEKKLGNKYNTNRPTVDLTTKPAINFFGVLLDFTNLDNFHHMFVKKDTECSVEVFDKSNRVLVEAYVRQLDSDVVVYSFDYTKKTLFIYTKSGAWHEIMFDSFPRKHKSLKLTDNKYPVSLDRDPIYMNDTYFIAGLNDIPPYGTTKIYLPKDEIERSIYFNHIIKYTINHIDNETIIILKYYDTKRD